MYGKYTVPIELQQLIHLQEKCKKEKIVPYGDLLGYYFAVEGNEARYFNTPLDVIPFARPGVDGIHFGFLTEFSEVNDLATAMIVKVTPMEPSRPVQLVAKNIHDFIRIIYYYPTLFEFNYIETSVHKAKYYNALTFTNEIQQVREQLFHTFELQSIDDIVGYYNRLLQDRQQQLTMPTEDGLGIVSAHFETATNAFPFNYDDYLSINTVKPYFETATYVEKLAFIRDVVSTGIAYNDVSLQLYLREQLQLLQLFDEAERLLNP